MVRIKNTGKANTARAAWCDLPRDALATILAHTGESPFRLAGVCKGWSWVLGCAQHRATLCFRHTHPGNTCFLEDAARSFATFVCSRPAVTTALEFDVDLAGASVSGMLAVYAALGAALTHLASSVVVLEVHSVHLSGLLGDTPFTDLCANLRSIKCHVHAPLNLRHVTSLTSVDLTISVDDARLVLPSTLRQCRLSILGDSPSPGLLHALPLMHRLDTLEVFTKGSCTLDVSRLSGMLHTLDVRSDAYMELQFGEASFPQLEILSMVACRFDAEDLGQFLGRCESLRGLKHQHCMSTGERGDGLDLRHLPLEAVVAVSDNDGPIISKLPRTLRNLALGLPDAGMSFINDAVAPLITSLTLYMDVPLTPAMLDRCWPRERALPNLEVLHVDGCCDAAAGFALGQRCANAAIETHMFDTDTLDIVHNLSLV